MIFLDPPVDFVAGFEVVLCFVEYDGHILLLLRQDHKPQGNQVGVPGGKINSSETSLSAAQRELSEETGLRIKTSKFEFIKKVYGRYDQTCITFYLYKTVQTVPQKITINQEEHKDFFWITPSEISDLKNSIEDLEEFTRIVYDRSNHFQL